MLTLPGPVVSLTRDELILIKLLSYQFTLNQVAGILRLDVSRVKWLYSELQNKLNVKSDIGIILYAIRQGIISV